MSQQFIRGSQIYFHNLRMMIQSMRRVAILSLTVGMVSALFYLFNNAHFYAFKPLLGVKYAFAKLHVSTNPQGEVHFEDIYGQTVTTSNGNYIYWYESRMIPEISKQLKLSSEVGFDWFLVTFLLIVASLYLKGKKQSKEQYLRGIRLIKVEKLKRIIFWHNFYRLLFNPYKINGIPYPKNTQYQHTIITGASGTGKTQIMLDLVDQIRKRGDRAVIYDRMGVYVRKFYDPGKDIILNPFDQRSKKWSFFAEGATKNVFDNMTNALIEESRSDPFWANAARAIVSEASLILANQGNLSTKSLCDMLLTTSNKEFSNFLKNTNAAAIADDTSDKTIASIRSVLSTYTKPLELLEDADEYFSIKKWITNKDRTDSILFLSSRIDIHETIKPLLTLWLDSSISQLLALDQEQKRTVWFIVDEMASLQKLPILTTGLAESRQFGGAFVISTQLISQLREVYGKDGSQTISGLCRNRLTFSTPDQETAHWCSENLGKKEIISAKENISFGASEFRDGINIAHNKEQESIVIPSEIMNLKDLEFYLKLSNGFPVTKSKIIYQDRFDVANRFGERELIKDSQQNSTKSTTIQIPISEKGQHDSSITEDEELEDDLDDQKNNVITKDFF